jgi:YesN/AraC family two-component response regulator
MKFQKGHLVNLKHGHNCRGSTTPTYRSWNSLFNRCYRENHISYVNYGAKGVKVCERWHNFVNFLEDMGERPSLEYCLSRFKDKGNYEPGNCEWKLKIKNNKEKVCARGEAQGLSVLTEAEVKRIREMYSDGDLSFTALGKQFNVSRVTISSIIKRKTWNHI